jgi:adenylylsulfate kinase
MADRTHGPVLWFTGRPAAGKSTLVAALRPRLEARWPVEILDGDEVRLWLSEELGFSRTDRDRNIARIAQVACLLARNGVAAMVAAVSPYAAARAQARAQAASQAIPFLEVFVSAPLAVLIQRDPKGMYRRAQAGEIANFTGLSDPYEEPEHPDLVIQTDGESVAASADRVVAGLRSRGLLPPL